jgi:hypothetical protein
MSQRFCLFFFEKRGELFEKNKQKTRFVKHAYPVPEKLAPGPPKGRLKPPYMRNGKRFA